MVEGHLRRLGAPGALGVPTDDPALFALFAVDRTVTPPPGHTGGQRRWPNSSRRPPGRLAKVASSAGTDTGTEARRSVPVATATG